MNGSRSRTKRGDNIPDGYLQKRGRSYGFYRDAKGNRHTYKAGDKVGRKIAKNKAGKFKKLGRNPRTKT